ncbi:MAG TPA: hypothetical protein VKA14_02910 [Gammaproteobacteria bacterium]|nr:hypothetical protein [Gammaproteobacteria bacterium]
MYKWIALLLAVYLFHDPSGPLHALAGMRDYVITAAVVLFLQPFLVRHLD